MTDPTATFRAATAEDSDRIADLVFGDPSQETQRVAVALYGVREPEQLRPLFHRLWRDAGNWRGTTLLMVDGEVAGVLQTGPSSMRVTPGAVLVAIRVLGWRALRLPFRLRLHDRVAMPKPDGSFVVSELHVAPAHRGRGLGTAALRYAEERAAGLGFPRVALNTYTTNPARALYEREGYVAVDERVDERFERLTGTAGNVLYVKDLTTSG